ncbi:MAG: FCD domain-containing protein [Rhodospirillales bacterium]|nr:FCD domain-containing protein [Rhodospirillales bacterium]
MGNTELKKTNQSWAPVRANSVANQIVMQVREALFSGKFQPGDLLGSEKDLAAQFDVSRITVRDALRTLETMGIVEIRVGAGGGARIAESNLDYFSDALAVQFILAGVTESEILDMQVAIEGTGAELAALHRSRENLEELAELLDDAEAVIDSPAEFTEAGQRFHLAVVEASGNRALIAQFRALRYVVWPQNAQRAKREIAENAQKIHHQLYNLIKAQNGNAARKLMIDHLFSIRAVSFSGTAEDAANGMICC